MSDIEICDYIPSAADRGCEALVPSHYERRYVSARAVRAAIAAELEAENG